MKQAVNPDDFIVSRKRKKYKFAMFFNSSLCFEYDEFLSDNRPKLADFQNITLEVGAGTGLFSVELAARHPQRAFIAIDVKADRLQKGAYEAEARGLENVWFVRARADQIDELFEPASIATIWLTFPDPFPRPRSARRRLTHPLYLHKYALLLQGSTLGKVKNYDFGNVYLKHDNLNFFTWSLEQLVQQHWDITELSFDLHDSMLDDEYKTKTTYEIRWLNEGLTTKFVKAGKTKNSELH